jgi:hypothetical protein
MIHPIYLPDDFIFRDPSKMKKIHYQSLLEHWYTRQEDDRIKVAFSFKGYWNPSSGSVIAVANKNPTNRKQPKRRGPPGIRQSDKGWEDVSGGSEEEDKGEGDEEDAGDDDDDDEESGIKTHRERGMLLEVPPKNLPFAAKRKAYGGAPVAQKKSNTRRPAAADLGPQPEQRITRSQGKRKADDAGLQSIGEPSSKKGRKGAVKVTQARKRK